MTKKRGMLALVGMLLATACGPGGEETGVGQDEELRLARADSVATAEGVYDSAVFDTIQWETPEAKLERGALVWRVSCVKCHGMEGGGDGNLATDHGFAVPDMGARRRHGRASTTFSTSWRVTWRRSDTGCSSATNRRCRPGACTAFPTAMSMRSPLTSTACSGSPPQTNSAKSNDDGRAR